MPVLLAFAILCLLAAAAVLVWRQVWRRRYVRAVTRAASGSFPAPLEAPPPLGWVALGFAVAAALFCLASSYKSVGTKEEGIETSFGKTVGHLDNGPHLTWPWVKVHEMDAAIQTDVYASHNDVKHGASASGPCIDTRIANQQLACVDVSLRWRIQPNSGDELYRDYRSFDHVRGSLVTRELRAAVNAAFSEYNPLDSISAASVPSGGRRNPSLQSLARRVRTTMRSEIGNRINVLSVAIPLIGYDEETQARINQLQQQIALTRIAEQQRLTNLKQAAANVALAKSVNTSPNVLVAECLNTLEQMVKNRMSVPAGFSCWPGGGVAAVIAPAQQQGKP